jgi:hypothetical protein
LALIQQDYGSAVSIGQELLSVKFGRAQCPIRCSHEAVNGAVWVEEKSGHRAVWNNAPDLAGARSRTRRVKRGNGLRRYWDGNCQDDQDGCRRLKFPFCEIEWLDTP